MIPTHQKRNLNSIAKAFNENSVALMECKNKLTGLPVVVLCAVNVEPDGTHVFIPFYKAFDGNPYDEVEPPESQPAPVEQMALVPLAPTLRLVKEKEN